MHQPDQSAGLQRVEAARYALLRRLALAMRHQLVVPLQPIGMVTEVMERRLRRPQPDLALLGADMQKVQGFAKAGVAAALDFVAWLAPEPGVEVALDAGVAECVQLLRTHFSFRGFDLRSQLRDGPQRVSRQAVRMLLPAVLFGLTDHAAAPAEVVVSGGGDGIESMVEVRVTPGTGNQGHAAHAPYRFLGWEEMEHLARSEGVVLTYSEGRACLRWS